jgi:YD repeat-containing protein
MILQFTGMKASLLLICIGIGCLSTSAQYFYNDILGTGDNKKNFSILQKEKIKKVTVKAYDSQGELIDDFVLYQEIDATKKILTTYSKTNLTDASILEARYNSLGLPVQITDSSEGGSTRTSYEYDSRGLLLQMSSLAIQQEQKENAVFEKRIYSYSSNQIPVTMMRIKGNTDTMQVVFLPAENGMPGEEQWFKDGNKIESWYYYYDAKNRLTDIVRYNAAAKKLLPDYLFNYDEAGNIVNKVTIVSGTSNFRIWQYRFDERGLKVEESVMDRQRKPEGKLVYEYK